jgi:hypothetical protein
MIRELLVIIMVCQNNVPRNECTVENARSYQVLHAPPGNVICAAPAFITVLDRPVEMKDDEYSRIRCSLK